MMTIEKLMFGIECVARATYENTKNYHDVWSECKKVLEKYHDEISSKDYLFVLKCIDTIGDLDKFEIFETWQDNYKNYDIVKDSHIQQYLVDNITEILLDNIQDIFISYQNDFGINDGGIDPLSEMAIYDNTSNLSETIMEAIINQIKWDS